MLSATSSPYVVPPDHDRFLLAKVHVNNRSDEDVSLITAKTVSPVVTDLDGRVVVFPAGARAKAYGISIRAGGATEWDMDVPLIRCDRLPGTAGRLAPGEYKLWAEMSMFEDSVNDPMQVIATGGPWPLVVR